MRTREDILKQMGDDRERIEKALDRMSPKQPEQRIAIMTCGRSARGCTAITCAWAFQEKLYHFEQYANAALPVRLCCIFPCNGCDSWENDDPGMRKKLDRLVLERVSRLHLSTCMQKCPQLTQICALLYQNPLVVSAYRSCSHPPSLS